MLGSDRGTVCPVGGQIVSRTERPGTIDWMALLDRAVAAHPFATPSDVRRLAPELRDWADKRLAKHIVLARQRLASRRGDDSARRIE